MSGSSNHGCSVMKHQKPIRIPSRSHSAKLFLQRPCQPEAPFCFGFASALCLAHAQRKETMGARKSSSIRLSFFGNELHFPACERPRPPAASAETTNKAACSRAANFIRAFISETFHPSWYKSCVRATMKTCGNHSSEKLHLEAESTAVVLPLEWRTRAEGRKPCCCRSSRAKASWASRTGLARD